jgi:hypothetical protein
MFVRKVLLPALFVAAAAVAAADPLPSVYEACAADHERLCPQQSITSEGSMRCLRQHSAEASTTCRAALNARRESVLDRVRAACNEEIRAHCSRAGHQAEVSPIRCLRAYRSRLSDACRSALPRRST